MSVRKEIIGACELYMGDCREVLPELTGIDAVVTDPPYGIGEAAGRAKNRTSGLSSRLRGAGKYKRDYGDDAWDDMPIDDDLMVAVMLKARWQIIFGGNYYGFPKTTCWLIWDKLNGNTDFADCEMAWTNLPKAVRRIQYHWNGCMRRERHIPREHPTQKPLEVMKWCIEHLPAPSFTILDPFMGSGTTGVACVKLGRRFIGVELEPKYFDIACRRIEAATKQPDLFIEQPKPAKQLSLLASE